MQSTVILQTALGGPCSFLRVDFVKMGFGANRGGGRTRGVYITHRSISSLDLLRCTLQLSLMFIITALCEGGVGGVCQCTTLGVIPQAPSIFGLRQGLSLS